MFTLTLRAFSKCGSQRRTEKALAILACALLLLVASSCSKKNPEEQALTPTDSIKTMRLSDDFHIELFASEPDVMSPVEMAFDETGKI
jgi:ferric-dicitrate binding protein FerR (iron transport regulator)